jgi:hypothetical protein
MLWPVPSGANFTETQRYLMSKMCDVLSSPCALHACYLDTRETLTLVLLLHSYLFALRPQFIIFLHLIS